MNETDRLASRKAFIDRRKHELAGLVLDGSQGRTGADYALWARQVMYRTDAMLAGMFDELCPAPVKPPAPLTEAEKAKIEADKKRPK
jgi:hypothetical protein